MCPMKLIPVPITTAKPTKIESDDDKPKVTILSIDGGGIRGVIPAYILGQLETYIREEHKKPNARIAEYFDVIAGTSTGSLLTAMLTAPHDKNKQRPRYDASYFVELYKSNGRKIFNKPVSSLDIFDKVWNFLLNVNRTTENFVDGLLERVARHKPKQLRRIVEENLGEVRVSDTVTNVVIPTFSTNKGKPVVIVTNMRNKYSDNDMTLKDAVLCSSSAPTYFPPYKMNFLVDNDIDEETFVDGGLGANNPSLVALCEATNKYGNEENYKNYLVLSLGTGQVKVETWRYRSFMEWVFKDIIPNLKWDFVMSAVNDAVEFQMSRFFSHGGTHSKNYLRIQKYDLKEEEAQMNNGESLNVQRLVEKAKHLLFEEKVKVVNPDTGKIEELEGSYNDALKDFVKKLVIEKERRDKAKMVTTKRGFSSS